MLGLQIGCNIWAEGVPDVAVTFSNVVWPRPNDILHVFEMKQSTMAKNAWLLAHCHPEQWVSQPLYLTKQQKLVSGVHHRHSHDQGCK